MRTSSMVIPTLLVAAVVSTSAVKPAEYVRISPAGAEGAATQRAPSPPGAATVSRSGTVAKVSAMSLEKAKASMGRAEAEWRESSVALAGPGCLELAIIRNLLRADVHRGHASHVRWERQVGRTCA